MLLAGIGLVKASAVLIPIGVARGRVLRPRLWRVICWIGGFAFIAYGALNVVVSGAVLAGVVRPDGGYDTDAMIGHAYLWDPLFLVWGGAPVVWLKLSAVRVRVGA